MSKRAVLDVTVVLLDDGCASTALLPIEVFHSAGALWRELRGEAPEPRFRVTTVSLDGEPVRCPYAGPSMTPKASIADIDRTDVVIVGTSGLALDAKLVEPKPAFSRAGAPPRIGRCARISCVAGPVSTGGRS